VPFSSLFSLDIGTLLHVLLTIEGFLSTCVCFGIVMWLQHDRNSFGDGFSSFFFHVAMVFLDDIIASAVCYWGLRWIFDGDTLLAA
jgi:hypothetical protein